MISAGSMPQSGRKRKFGAPRCRPRELIKRRPSASAPPRRRPFGAMSAPGSGGHRTGWSRRAPVRVAPRRGARSWSSRTGGWSLHLESQTAASRTAPPSSQQWACDPCTRSDAPPLAWEIAGDTYPVRVFLELGGRRVGLALLSAAEGALDDESYCARHRPPPLRPGAEPGHVARGAAGDVGAVLDRIGEELGDSLRPLGFAGPVRSVDLEDDEATFVVTFQRDDLSVPGRRPPRVARHRGHQFLRRGPNSSRRRPWRAFMRRRGVRTPSVPAAAATPAIFFARGR